MDDIEFRAAYVPASLSSIGHDILLTAREHSSLQDRFLIGAARIRLRMLDGYLNYDVDCKNITIGWWKI